MNSAVRVALGAAALLTATAAAPAPVPTQPTSLVVLAGNLIPDAATGAIGPATVTVRDGRIVSVQRGLNRPTDGSLVVDRSGETVLPGLIDAHVHLTGDPGGDWWREAVDTPEWSTIIGVKNALATARAGFTTVRDVGGEGGAVFALRRALDEGVVEGPRMLASGPPLSVIGGHGDVHGYRPEVMAALDGHNTCTGADECAKVVRQRARDGADVIKFHATGGVLSQGDKSLGQAFSDVEMKSIVDTAHSLGLKVAAHAHADQGIRAAVRAGVDSIEHGTFASDQTLREMKTRGTVLVPTLLAFKGIGEGLGKGVYTPAVERKIRMTLDHVGDAARRAHAIGVKIVFGTDSGVTRHGRNAEEFAMLEAAGLSPREAIAAATTGAADLLGLQDQIGRIAPGYSADMVGVAGDPLNDARVLEKVDWTMVRGHVVSRGGAEMSVAPVR